MTGLPENWEWDYDGKRWFYRYKPTGLIQYTFPKPGDEFPEFICDDTDEPLDLPPEEKLVSQQQVKRKNTLGESQSKQKTATAAQRNRSSSNAVSEPDDGDGPFWFQPDGLMYMGPGAYNDISPLQEEDEEEERGVKEEGDGRRGKGEGKTNDKQDVASEAAIPPLASAAATATADMTAGKDAAQPPPRSQASPAAGAENAPHMVNGLPATTTPELDSVPVKIEPTEQQAADNVARPVQPPEVPLLDGREVSYDPVGVVAELPSEFTVKCAEEINPAPVELPSNEVMRDESGPASYVNAFHLDPVELPSDEVNLARAPEHGASKEPTRQQEEQAQQQSIQQAAQHLPSRPYVPLRQNSLPQVTTTPVSNPAPMSTQGKYQPYHPAKAAVLAAATTSQHPGVEAQTSQLVSDNKRHTISGAALWQTQLSKVPPPPRWDAEQSAGTSSNGVQSAFPSARPRFESPSGLPAAETPGGLAHVPSVLKPARGRPVIRNQSPLQSQGASAARIYQPYKPSSDLQREIEDTVRLLSKTGYGQETTAAETSGPARPQPSRTSTLPADLPDLPSKGGRPHLPHSATSEPVTLQISDVPPQAPHETTSAVSSGAPGGPDSLECATPLSPSNSAVPPPLRLPRKSLQLGTDTPTIALLPSVASPPIITTPPIITSSVVAADAADKGGGPSEQSGAAVQLDVPVSSGQPHLGGSPGPGHETDQVAAPATQPSRSPGPFSEQVASSNGCSAATEPTSSPAPRAAVPTQPAALQSATSNQEHQLQPQPNVTPPTNEDARGHISPPATASPVALFGSVPPSDNFASKPEPQQAAAPVGPSAMARPPSPRTPSPISRVSSPPSHSATSRDPPSVTASPDQHNNQATVVRSGTCEPAPSPPAPSDQSVMSLASEEYTIPPGHHPLASHPVRLVSSPPPPPPKSGLSDASNVASPPSSEGATPIRARNDASSPPSVQDQGQKTVQSAGPQGPTASLHAEHAKPPAGQAAPAQSSQVLTDSMPHGPNQAAQYTAVVFPPPATSSGMPPQHRYSFQPGAPVPPHTMQPSQMLGGQYVVQKPQAAPPVKGEKSWFGRLLRVDSIRRQTSSNRTSRQQKMPAQQQAHPMSPPHLQPIQPTAALQFAPQASPVPSQFFVAQPGQQAQQAPIMQQQQQQQQLQQPLMWKTSTGGDPTNPRFPAPRRNPDQPFMPPPDVMQSIKKQELRLQQPSYVNNASPGQGQGQGPPPLNAAAHGGNSQGAASEQVKVANDKAAVVAATVTTEHGEKASGWGKTNGGISSLEYDGSGWGNEERQ
ncbi:hypothetical protein VTH06DRAFT_5957 [Thermothelomyces fergusii]